MIRVNGKLRGENPEEQLKLEKKKFSRRFQRTKNKAERRLKIK
jgi:hypothetical protein